MLRPDPPVRRDGRCYQCGGERRFEKLKLLYRQAAEADPFCSTECARVWHGTSLASPLPGPKVGAERVAIGNGA